MDIGPGSYNINQRYKERGAVMSRKNNRINTP